MAVSQCGSMLSSDWLFHSVAHFSSSHSRKEKQGKYIFQYFRSQLYRWVKYGHQGAAINMQGIETAFECKIAFYFPFILYTFFKQNKQLELFIFTQNLLFH